jgi:hypothetical protein
LVYARPISAAREHLLEHPRVRADGRFIGAVDREVDDDRRRAVAALRRPALREAAHVVGPRLRALDALLEAAVRPFVRAGVVDRLPLLEQLDGAVDSRRLRRLRGKRDGSDQTDRRPEETAEIAKVAENSSLCVLRVLRGSFRS